MKTYKDFLEEQRSTTGYGFGGGSGGNTYGTGSQPTRLNSPLRMSRPGVSQVPSTFFGIRMPRGAHQPKPRKGIKGRTVTLKPEYKQALQRPKVDLKPSRVKPRTAKPTKSEAFFVNMIRGLKNKALLLGGLGTGAMAALHNLGTAWNIVDTGIDLIIRMLPLPTGVKDFLRNNTLAVITVMAAAGVSHKQILKMPGRVRRALKNKETMGEIEDAIDMGDEELARQILFDALQNEGMTIRYVRNKLSADQWLDLSMVIAKAR